MKLINDDCIEAMKQMLDNSVDSVVTDPPYGISFMGKAWDNAAIMSKAVAGKDHTQTTDRSGSMHAGSYDTSNKGNKAFEQWTYMWAVEAFRVLKPGGQLISFASPRTYHRMASGIEDAGFEIRDQIMWLFGSGFPKSLNLKDEWDGWGTALKPAHEPMVLARKPLIGTVVNNVLKYGTGALNINDSRVREGREKTQAQGKYVGSEVAIVGQREGGKIYPQNLGRWPANIIHDGSDEVLELFPNTKATGNGKVSGFRKGGASENSVGLAGVKKSADGFSDSGSAARFFYCAKAATKDRNEGLDGFAVKQQDESRKEGNPGGDNPRNRGLHQRANHHPTVKPTELMKYLVKLITPPNGTVLDPFMGSGSTGKACAYEGFDFIGIDQSSEYVEIAKARINYVLEMMK